MNRNSILLFLGIIIIGSVLTLKFQSYKHAFNDTTAVDTSSLELAADIRPALKKQLTLGRLSQVEINSISIENKNLTDIFKILWEKNEAQLKPLEIKWAVSYKSKYQDTVNGITKDVYTYGEHEDYESKLFSIKLESTDLLSVIDHICELSGYQREVLFSKNTEEAVIHLFPQ